MKGKPFQKGHDPRRVNPRPAGSQWELDRKPKSGGRLGAVKISEEDRDAFLAMYLNPEIPFSAIARQFGVCRETVANTAKRMGLGLRMPMLERAKLGPWARSA